MVIDKELLDELTSLAKQTPRLRQAYDLRNSIDDKSQRMLNALEPGTVLPTHCHGTTSEAASLIRGRVRQNMYDDKGNFMKTFIASADGFPNFYVAPMGMWYNTECLESGTVIFEAKDGAYTPLIAEDIISLS